MQLDRLFDRTIPEPNSGCMIWLGAVNKDGYPSVGINSKTLLATRLVLSQKLGRPLMKSECACHKCDVPSCINPDHLWAGTHRENIDDRTRKSRAPGNSMPGSQNPSAILSEDNVLEIASLTGTMMQREIAEIFGVSRATISDIQCGRKWAHITKITRAA
ncbi:HNH endonuclease [Brucella oryzae]|uniref:HNH endonuclease n=1 Tax=Brucella oryzae TaxID=335286 RepID=A0A2S7IUH9_9HYPH|nr:HNH endonuclease [Brucella oryzae]PQA71673.1 HNH endonuclease [Brucella oryzae]